MNIVVKKGKPSQTEINIGGSKSAIIRYLICAYLSGQNITLHNVTYSDDVNATISCLKNMGAEFEIKQSNVTLLKVNKIKPKSLTLDVKASATLLRLLIPLNLVLFPNVKIIYKCKDNLLNRPLDGYQEFLASNHVDVKQKSNSLIIKGKISSRKIIIDAQKSSQFASGVLIALPLCDFNTTLEILNLNVSRSYFELTKQILREFNIKIDSSLIEGKQKYITKQVEFMMPTDFDLALVLTLIALNNGDISFKYYGKIPSYFQILIDCGAQIEISEKEIKVHKSKLCGLKIDFSNYIDTALAFMAFACTLETPSTFSSLERLKYKESNRLSGMLEIFDELHISYEMKDDEITIYPHKFKLDNMLDSHLDHRLVMAQIILLSGQKGKIEIAEAQVIKKSAPQFFEVLKKMGFTIKALRRPHILIAIRNENDLLLPADGYVVGYEKFTQFASQRFTYLKLKEITKHKKIYLLLNALIHQNELIEVEEEIKKLKDLELFYIVQDLGLMEILKKYVDHKRIILMPYTLICSKCDAKSYMKDDIASIGLSNEITLQDIYDISCSVNSFLTIFGYVPMYQSYRKIVSLFLEHTNLKLDNKNNLTLKEDTRDEYYHVEENEYGSTIYRPYPLNYLTSLNYLWHLKYVFIERSYLAQVDYENAVILVNKYYKNHINSSEIKAYNEWKSDFRNDFLLSDSIYRRDEL